MRHAIETTPHRRFGRFTPEISEEEYARINDAIEALAEFEIPEGVSNEGMAVIGQLKTNIASTVTHARQRLNREFTKYALAHPFAHMTDAALLQHIDSMAGVSVYGDHFDGRDYDNRAGRLRSAQKEATVRGLI